MERINEKESANRFMKKIQNGYFADDRSQNTEVNYKEEKEERDTEMVRSFLRSQLFLNSLKK